MGIAAGTPNLTESMCAPADAQSHSLTHKRNGRSTIPTVMLLSVFLFGRPAEAEFAGGTGSADTPYRIATAEHILSIGSTRSLLRKHFVLVNDIDLDPNLPGGQVFEDALITPDQDTDPWWEGNAFTGRFDGDGHCITHMTIVAETTDNVGLFGAVGTEGRVCNLGLIAVVIHGAENVGALTGRNSGTISDCEVVGSVSGKAWVGGLVGQNF